MCVVCQYTQGHLCDSSGWWSVHVRTATYTVSVGDGLTICTLPHIQLQCVMVCLYTRCHLQIFSG